LPNAADCPAGIGAARLPAGLDNPGGYYKGLK